MKSTIAEQNACRERKVSGLFFHGMESTISAQNTCRERTIPERFWHGTHKHINAKQCQKQPWKNSHILMRKISPETFLSYQHHLTTSHHHIATHHIISHIALSSPASYPIVHVILCRHILMRNIGLRTCLSYQHPPHHHIITEAPTVRPFYQIVENDELKWHDKLEFGAIWRPVTRSQFSTVLIVCRCCVWVILIGC